MKLWQLLADFRPDFAAIQHSETRHQLVIGLGEFRSKSAALLAIGRQYDVERAILAVVARQGIGRRVRRRPLFALVYFAHDFIQQIRLPRTSTNITRGDSKAL